jgi:hypothetical protein
MKAKYTSPYTVGKRQTVYIDANDPRVRNPIKYGITTARLGSDFVIVTDGGATTPIGKLSSIQNSGGPTYSTTPDPFSPTSTNFIKPSDISNIAVAWSGSTLVITFDFDFAKDKNKYVQGFQYKLTANSYTSQFIKSTVLNKTGLQQTINFTSDLNRRYFGPFQQTFSSLQIQAYDSFGNVGDLITLSVIPSYSNSLPAPTITVTAINQGYTVDWSSIAQTYQYIAVEEIESTANTAPTTGYDQVYLDSIKPATIIRPNTNSRWVKARFTDNEGTYGPYSTAYKVTPESPVVVDNTAPNAPTSGSVTAGVDNSSGATIGFNAYVDISWSAVADSTLKGYRIRFRENGTSNPYSYVDSPGTGTTFRLNGLAIGTIYEVGIASYDEFNNTSSAYFSIGTAQATGTPFIGKNVTTVGYFGASATGDTGTFKFGYGVQDSGGVKRGLVFNSNNYWYIDSSQSATFKLGGDTNNYIQWNGSEFIVQGDLRARAGNFQGNVEIISGGSIYSGTLSGNNLSGAGFILNNSGLTFNSSSVNGITTINATDGKFTTASANIGGWDVTSSVISKTSLGGNGTITLDSSDVQIKLTSASYTAGIATPNSNSPTDIVFWAGGARTTAASFYVTANGNLYANNAFLTGLISTGPGLTGMRFGPTASPTNLGVGSQDGLYINSANYWFANGAFKIGGGVISGTHDSVSINGGSVTLEAIGTVESDSNNFAGDPTLTLNSSNNIVKGRRFIFNGSTSPSSSVTLTNGQGTWTTGGGTTTPVKVGDILMVS